MPTVLLDGETALTGILADVGNLVSAGIQWMGNFVSAITNDTSKILVTFVVAVPLVGLGIGLLKRLVSVRA